jgi:hypothetical protein
VPTPPPQAPKNGLRPTSSSTTSCASTSATSDADEIAKLRQILAEQVKLIERLAARITMDPTEETQMLETVVENIMMNGIEERQQGGRGSAIQCILSTFALGEQSTAGYRVSLYCYRNRYACGGVQSQWVASCNNNDDTYCCVYCHIKKYFADSVSLFELATAGLYLV